MVFEFVADVVFWTVVWAFIAWQSAPVLAGQPPFDPGRGLRQERSALMMFWAWAPLASGLFALMLWPLPSVLDTVVGFAWPMPLAFAVFSGAALAAFRLPKALLGATVAAMVLVSVVLGTVGTVAFRDEAVLGARWLSAVVWSLGAAGVPTVAAFIVGWITYRLWGRRQAAVGALEPGSGTIEQARQPDARKLD